MAALQVGRSPGASRPLLPLAGRAGHPTRGSGRRRAGDARPLEDVGRPRCQAGPSRAAAEHRVSTLGLSAAGLLALQASAAQAAVDPVQQQLSASVALAAILGGGIVYGLLAFLRENAKAKSYLQQASTTVASSVDTGAEKPGAASASSLSRQLAYAGPVRTPEAAALNGGGPLALVPTPVAATSIGQVEGSPPPPPASAANAPPTPPSPAAPRATSKASFEGNGAADTTLAQPSAANGAGEPAALPVAVSVTRFEAGVHQAAAARGSRDAADAASVASAGAGTDASPPASPGAEAATIGLGMTAAQALAAPETAAKTLDMPNAVPQALEAPASGTETLEIDATPQPRNVGAAANQEAELLQAQYRFKMAELKAEADRRLARETPAPPAAAKLTASAATELQTQATQTASRGLLQRIIFFLVALWQRLVAQVQGLVGKGGSNARTSSA